MSHLSTNIWNKMIFIYFFPYTPIFNFPFYNKIFFLNKHTLLHIDSTNHQNWTHIRMQFQQLVSIWPIVNLKSSAITWWLHFWNLRPNVSEISPPITLSRKSIFLTCAKESVPTQILNKNSNILVKKLVHQNGIPQNSSKTRIWICVMNGPVPI